MNFKVLTRTRVAHTNPSDMLTSMTLKAVIHKAEEGGFWAEVPALPGCVTQGETMEELRANLEDAVKLWLEAGEPEKTQIKDGEIVELAI